MNYVVGFVFDESMNRIALIEKNRPDWQKGKWNGVGGKIENDETPASAMIRECEEEFGILVEHWDQLTVLKFDNNAVVHIFKTVVENELFDNIHQTTDEPVIFTTVAGILREDRPVIDNLRWLVPMCVAEKANIPEIKLYS